MDSIRAHARASQTKNEAYLLSQDINPNYISEYGAGLLSQVITSNLRENDKMMWLERLVNEGADVNHMNEFGKNVLSAAEYKELPEIYDWLVKNGANPIP